MSILKTKESLQRMFEERKRIQEKKRKRQEHNKQKKQQLQAIYRHQDQILKKSLQELKKTTMDNLSKLVKKHSQKVRKLPQIESYNYYQDVWQLKEPNESELYQTIEELKQWEQENYPCINWNKWREIILQTKKEINQSIQYERNKTQRETKS